VDRRHREHGFTLVELLVVVLIIAILAAIAIPLFIRQRHKAYQADITAALRSGATAAEGYGAQSEGDYSGLNGDAGVLLGQQGYRASPAVSISVAATPSDYCLTATYSLLPAGHPWQTATYDYSIGKPTEANVCP
jgi:prepilin-type N-terminal cleavage/methylation domain-containing protein